MKRKQQIKWIVKHYKDNGLKDLCSTNFRLECEFVEGTGVDLSYKLWKERIRSAAKELGLSSCRMYNTDASPGAGIPRYSMIYFNDHNQPG